MLAYTSMMHESTLASTLEIYYRRYFCVVTFPSSTSLLKVFANSKLQIDGCINYAALLFMGHLIRQQTMIDHL